MNSRNLQARLILVSLKLGFFRLGILLAVSGKDLHVATLSVYGVTPLRVFDPGFHFVWSGRKSAALFDAKSSIVRRSAAAGERVFVSVAPRLCYSVAQTLRGILMAICKLYGGVIGLVKSVLVDSSHFWLANRIREGGGRRSGRIAEVPVRAARSDPSARHKLKDDSSGSGVTHNVVAH